MNWHLIAAWAYGFFWPIVFVSVAVAAAAAVIGYASLQEHFALSVKAAWSGLFVLVAIGIVGGIIAANVLQ